MNRQTELFGGGVRPGDRVRLQLWTGAYAEGVVTTETEASPATPNRRFVWVRIEQGPEWAVGEESQHYTEKLETA